VSFSADSRAALEHLTQLGSDAVIYSGHEHDSDHRRAGASQWSPLVLEDAELIA
jgi:hypothetical protein